MMPRTRFVWSLASLASACGGDHSPAPTSTPQLTERELMDPAACKSCHPTHVDEWSASRHAASSKDPVFLAMNRRGQEETNGELGDFCVQCHAPVAVARGLIKNYAELESLDETAQGVTCYYCHSVSGVTRDNDNGLALAKDHAVRGPIRHPAAGAPHEMVYSTLHDRTLPSSSDLCGSCHDVVLPNSLKLERTAIEWRGSAFAPNHAPSPTAVTTCTGCHMADEDGPSVIGFTTSHISHDHRSSAVDIELSPDPSDPVAAEQRQHVEAFLDTSLGTEICVMFTGASQSAVYVTLDNTSAGHFFPSGASHDRKVWLEVRAFDAGGAALYTSGAVGPDEGGDSDPDLWSFGDVAFAKDGSRAHMFWNIDSLETHGIPAPTTFDPSSPDLLIHQVSRRFPKSLTATIQGAVARVTVTAHFRPIGFDVLDDLVGSGHLDAATRDAMPVFDLIPDRHLSNHATLSALAGETFEWSDATRNSTSFGTRTLYDDAFPKFCVSNIQKR